MDDPGGGHDEVLRQIQKVLAEGGAPIREALTLLHLFRAAASAPSGAPFYDKVLDLIEALFDAEIILILIHDRKRGLLQWAASRGLPVDPSHPPAQPVEGTLRRLFLDERPSLLGGVDRDPYFCFRDTFRERGIPSVVGLPLQSSGRPLGVLCFYAGALKNKDDLTPIDPQRLDLLASILWEIGTRAENLQLIQEIADRARDARALMEVSQSVSSTLDLTEVFRRISRETAQYLGADMVGAYRLDPKGATLIPVAGYSVPKEKREVYQRTDILISEFPFIQQHLETQRPGLFQASDPRFKIPPPLRELFPLKSFLFIPMLAKGKTVGGLFVVWWNEERLLRPDEIALIEVFSRQAAIAAENAELYHALDLKIKELTQLQAQMLQTEKLSAIGELISGVAHELNNPLTSILGFSELILKSPRTDAVRRQVEIIRSEAARSSKIIQSLLAFARSDRFELKKTDLASLLKRTLEIKSPHFALDGVEAAVEFQEGLPPLWVDENQIQQVFLNILNNAHQALMEKEGPRKLIIQGRLRNSFARIAFIDNGPGIPEDLLSKIFDPFFTTKPVGVGTGLGLSVSYGIIKAHGGRLTAESRKGEGARFYVDLPIRPVGTSPKAEARAEAKGPGGRLAQKRILALDDEAHILELLRNFLTLQGAEVATAPTASEALALLRERPFDLVISDVKMPEMDGLQFYRALVRERPELANRVLFLTGDVMNPKTRRFLDEGRRLFLKKPFQIQELNEAIARSLGEQCQEEGGASL